MHVTADRLSVTIDRTSILSDVSFEIRRGAMIGLIGPNGSGKSTLLRAVAGIQSYSGSLRLDGREVSEWTSKELARALAFLQQTLRVDFDFTVEQLVLLGRNPHRGWLQAYTADDRRIVQQALERVQLQDFIHRSVLTLSGGELQRVLLAQALVQEAPLLLLDEPTAHLDVHHRFEFMEIVQELVGVGRTVVTVFHDLDLASRFADWLLVLDQGRLVADGPTTDLLTEELIHDVFRMEASVAPSHGGVLKVTFRGRSSSTNAHRHEDLHANRR